MDGHDVRAMLKRGFGLQRFEKSGELGKMIDEVGKKYGLGEETADGNVISLPSKPVQLTEDDLAFVYAARKGMEVEDEEDDL